MFSCTTKKKEVIDLSEIMPYTVNDSISIEDLDDNDSLKMLKEVFQSNGIPVSDIGVINVNLFPVRFGPESKMSYQLIIEEDTVDYHKWTYADSTKVMNAFYNWIDCFGKKCQSIYLGDEARFQSDALLILVGDTSLIYVTGGKIDSQIWYDYHNSLGYDPNWNFTIEQKKNRSAKWYNFEDKIKIKYTKE